MSTILEINGSSFDIEILQSDKPVLVEFGATWCGPCKRQKPVLEQLATAHPDVKVAVIDIDESPDIASKYGVRAVPTLMLFNNGNRVDALIGLMPLKSLEILLTKLT